MTTTKNIRDIFSMLHDGTIIAWVGDKNSLTLTVDCEYLAKRIDRTFDNFYVELKNIVDLYLATWPNPFDLPVETLTDLNKIFDAELEIHSAEIREGKVEIACNQHDTNFNYCGGNLTIACQSIKVYDQNKNELTIDEFDKICKGYWDDMGKKLENEIINRIK